MSKKTTKRALAMSFVSVFLCVCMLVGTTFAWFTDSVSSVNNVIQSGNLDVVLEVGTLRAGGDSANPNDWNWNEVDPTKPVIELDNVEPGYVKTVALRVRNAGSLALKYALSTSIVEETEGVNVAGNKFNLSDKLYTFTSKSLSYTDWNREKILDIIDITLDGNFSNGFGSGTANTAVKAFNTEICSDMELLTKDDYDAFAFAVAMPTWVGNEANHNGTAPKLTFGINVVATQLTYEKDSFGNDYDAKAEYPNVVGSAAELSDALANGKDVVLSGDIVDAPVNTKAPYGNYYGVALNGGVLDGNGNSLDFSEGELNNGSLDNYGIMVSAGTIKNVDITGVFRGIVIMNPTDDIYIDNVTIGDEDVCYAINTAEGDGTHSLIVTNSTIAGWNSYGDAIKDLSFTNCTFAQGEYYTNVYGRLVKPYVTTVFENCEFSSKYYIDLSSLEDGCTITLKNCTVNGVKLTAENWKDLIVAEDVCGNGQISIEGKDGTYMSTSNIFDYVVID